MEKVGTGIKRIKQYCRQNNNDVEIKPTETHFFVKMYALEQPEEGVKDGAKLNRTEKKLLEFISKNKNITSKDLAEKIGITKRGVRLDTPIT